MDHNNGNYSQPWTAVLGCPDPSFTHHGLPMDLHISQGFSYYNRWLMIEIKSIAADHKLHFASAKQT